MEKQIYNITMNNKVKYLLLIGFINLLYTYILVLIAQMNGLDLLIYLENTLELSQIEYKIIKYIHVILLFISIWFIYYCLFDFLNKYKKSNLKRISFFLFPFIIFFATLPLMFYYIYYMNNKGKN